MKVKIRPVSAGEYLMTCKRILTFIGPWFRCGARLLKQLRATFPDQGELPPRSCFNKIAKSASYFSAAPNLALMNR